MNETIVYSSLEWARAEGDERLLGMAEYGIVF